MCQGIGKSGGTVSYSERQAKLLVLLWVEFGSTDAPSTFFTIDPKTISEKCDLELFASLDWDRPSISELNNCDFAMYYLTVPAFKYVLPRLLTLLVQGGGDISGQPIVDHIFNLVRQNDFASLVASLSESQKQIYAEIMDYIFLDNESYSVDPTDKGTIRQMIMGE